MSGKISDWFSSLTVSQKKMVIASIPFLAVSVFMTAAYAPGVVADFTDSNPSDNVPDDKYPDDVTVVGDSGDYSSPSHTENIAVNGENESSSVLAEIGGNQVEGKYQSDWYNGGNTTLKVETVDLQENNSIEYRVIGQDIRSNEYDSSERYALTGDSSTRSFGELVENSDRVRVLFYLSREDTGVVSPGIQSFEWG